MPDLRPCALCSGDEDYAALCEGHSDSVQRLAHALAEVYQPEDTDETARWFIEDAAVIADGVAEGDAWNAEMGVGPIFQNLTVNGTRFYIDTNEEGPGIPRRCTCTPEGCDEGCYVCQRLVDAWPCPAEAQAPSTNAETM